MAAKILVNYPGALTKEALESKRQDIADKLCVCCEDVVFVTGATVSVVDLPDELTAAREKADKEAAAEAEKAAKEQAKIEADAIKAESARAAEAAKAAAPAPAAEPKAPAATDYDSMTLDELHAEAVKRDLQGRSGLNKAELVKALHKDDKGK